MELSEHSNVYVTVTATVSVSITINGGAAVELWETVGNVLTNTEAKRAKREACSYYTHLDVGDKQRERAVVDSSIIDKAQAGRDKNDSCLEFAIGKRFLVSPATAGSMTDHCQCEMWYPSRAVRENTYVT
jgi:hypothetical protein